MPTVYLLNAVDCPPLVLPAGLHDPAALTPKVFFSQQPGVPATVTTGLRSNAVRSENIARYGGGAYAVAAGLEVAAGSGLSGTVTAGVAMLDGPVVVPTAPAAVTLADGARNWIWMLPTGLATGTSGSLTPPLGACCLLGSLLTAAGAVSGDPDASGRWELRCGSLYRRTGDAGAPTDNPAAWAPNLLFFHQTAGGMYLWDGTAYRSL